MAIAQQSRCTSLLVKLTALPQAARMPVMAHRGHRAPVFQTWRVASRGHRGMAKA